MTSNTSDLSTKKRTSQKVNAGPSPAPRERAPKDDQKTRFISLATAHSIDKAEAEKLANHLNNLSEFCSIVEVRS